MEDALRVLGLEMNGTCSHCLNPYCNGRCFARNERFKSSNCKSVLILIVMEDTL